MRRLSKGFSFFVVISIINLIVMLYFILRMPSNVPLQVGSAGQITRTGSRWMYLILGGLPLINCISTFFVPKIDPKQDSYASHARPFRLNQYTITLILVALSWVAMPISHADQPGFTYPVVKIVIALVGLLFIVAGNYLPKAEINYTWGIKTPWTLEDPTIWRKTHRMSGWLYTAMGASLILSSLVPSPGFVTFILLGAIALMLVVPRIYAWRLYSKSRKEQSQ